MKDLSNENVIHVIKDDVQYIQFKKLLNYKDRLKHCYTMKELNFRNKAKEDDDYIKICQALNLDNNKIVKPVQTHTNVVQVVNENSISADFKEVDGLVTNKHNKVLSLVFADCTPILLFDPVKNVIGNIHSGWRGTVAKIGKVAVEKMVNEFECKPENIIACIGPTIRDCHFEVEDDVMKLFKKSFNDDSIIKKANIVDGKQKYYINTVKANKNMLKDCGLIEENIVDSGLCTVCNNELFHSYRSQKQNAGRNATFMCIV